MINSRKIKAKKLISIVYKNNSSKRMALLKTVKAFKKAFHKRKAHRK